MVLLSSMHGENIKEAQAQALEMFYFMNQPKDGVNISDQRSYYLVTVQEQATSSK